MSVNRRGEAGFTLLELLVVCLVLGIVTVIVSDFLVSAGRTVSVASGRAADNAAAQQAVALLEADVRYASAVAVSPDGSTLSVTPCTSVAKTWQFTGSSLLDNGSPILRRGVSGGSFAAQSGLTGLYTMHFVLDTANQTSSGVEVADTLVAQDIGSTTC